VSKRTLSINQNQVSPSFSYHLFCVLYRYPEALDSFSEAISAVPSDPLAHFRGGNVHFALQQYAEAQEEYEVALRCCKPVEDDALVPKIHVNLGITQEANGMLVEACEQYK
jgi:tetratricopeptide (TPR) repeat protein